jgi:hypothetical protein
MALAATFLSGAKSRLLPASVPFRYFGAALAFHLLAWLLVLLGAPQVPSFAGGLGAPLGALHAVTLGVLLMTAMGASLQLLPVATRQSVGSPRLAATLWWVMAPGSALVVAGMAHAWPGVLAAGAALVLPALLGFTLLLARNLQGARGMPVVVAHGWAALVCLGVLLASAGSLVATWLGWTAAPRTAALGWHVAFAAYGVMGLLIMGFSHILVPMFALSDAPPVRPSLCWLAVACVSLAAAATAALTSAPWNAVFGCAAALGGLVALVGHVLQMRHAMRTGMRRDLGPSFRWVHAGWALLAASLLAALALQSGLVAWPRLAPLFGVLLACGLLSVLMGILARILPFLASMHAPPGRRGPPMPSTLTADRPLAWHHRAHGAAVALLILAIALDSAWLARAAGAAGSVSAVAMLLYFRFAWMRMHAPPAVPAAEPPRTATVRVVASHKSAATEPRLPTSPLQPAAPADPAQNPTTTQAGVSSGQGTAQATRTAPDGVAPTAPPPEPPGAGLR